MLAGTNFIALSFWLHIRTEWMGFGSVEYSKGESQVSKNRNKLTNPFLDQKIKYA